MAAKAAKPPKPAADTRAIMQKLERQHPNADTELHYSNAYELLVATILSAQCTDERVNQVTPALFKRYPNAVTLARATTGDLEPQIQSTGFFRAKSKSLVGMASAVRDRHQGEVPADMDALTELPGVGRKTANVVLGHALGVPGLPVDRHVLRVSNRIGIAKGDDPEVVEQQLCDALPKDKWTVASDTLILHGRRICKPKPLCDKCAVRDECLYYKQVVAHQPASGTTRAKSRPAKGTRQPGKDGAKAAPRRAPQGTGNAAATGGPARGTHQPGAATATVTPRRAPQGTGNAAATGRPARGTHQPGAATATVTPRRAPQGTRNAAATGRPAREKE